MVNSNFRRIIHTTRLSLSLERRLLLYGYYNSDQPQIHVKIYTAVDKEKGYDKLADMIRTNMDIEMVYKIIGL